MKPCIYLDPSIFASPKPEDGIIAFLSYINNIISWSELVGANWISIYISALTEEILAQTNSYPLWKDLKDAITGLAINDIHPREVVTLVDSLLLKTPTIEDETGILELLICDFECIPSEYFSNRLSVYIEQHNRLLALMSLSCEVLDKSEKDNILITCNTSNSRTEIAVTGQVIDIDFSNNHNNINIPYNINSTFCACNSPHGLYTSVDPVEIWINALDEDDYTKSIFVFLYQIINDLGNPEIDIDNYNWTIGPCFVSTVAELGFKSQPSKVRMLLRAISETVLKLNLSDTHWLRTGEGANDPQREINNKKAWRRDIDHCFHLHYWETEAGPEFASIVTHNDMSIPN